MSTGEKEKIIENDVINGINNHSELTDNEKKELKSIINNGEYFVLYPENYEKLKNIQLNSVNKFEDYYSTIAISGLNKNGRPLLLKVFNRDSNGKKIQFRNSYTAETTSTTDAHDLPLKRVNGIVSNIKNVCNSGSNSSSSSGSSSSSSSSTNSNGSKSKRNGMQGTCPCQKNTPVKINKLDKNFDKSISNEKALSLYKNTIDKEYDETLSTVSEGKEAMIKGATQLIDNKSSSESVNELMKMDEEQLSETLLEDISNSMSNPDVKKTRLWLSKLNKFLKYLKKHIKNLKIIAKYTGKREDNEKVNNFIILENSVLKKAGDVLEDNDYKSIKNSNPPDEYENFMNIRDQQSELEVEGLESILKVVPLFEETDQNSELIITEIDGPALEIDDNGNINNNIDHNSISVSSNSYGESLEKLTKNTLNALEYTNEVDVENIVKGLNKLYKSLSMKMIFDPDPKTTYALNRYYSQVYGKLVAKFPEYKTSLEPPLNRNKWSYVPEVNINYNQKLELENNINMEYSNINNVFNGGNGQYYHVNLQHMINAYKSKLIKAMINKDQNTKNAIMSKLHELSKVIKKYSNELENTSNGNLTKFEPKLLLMADMIHAYNEILSVAFINNDNKVGNVTLMPIEPSSKMIACLNVYKYKQMIKFMKYMKQFNPDILPYDGKKDKSQEPSYSNLSKAGNKLSAIEAFKNFNFDEYPTPVSQVIFLFKAFEAVDEALYIADIRLTNTIKKGLIKLNNSLIRGLLAANKVLSPMDRDPDDMYSAKFLSSITDSSGQGDHSIADDTTDDIIEDTYSSALSELKSFTNDKKLLPYSEVKTDESSGEIIGSSLVEGETTTAGAMNYVKNKVKELNESGDPEKQEQAKKISGRLKKGFRKLKKQVTSSIGRSSKSDISKVNNNMKSMGNVVSTVESNSNEFSSSTMDKMEKKNQSSSPSGSNSNSNSKVKNKMNSKKLKKLRKSLKKLLKKLNH